MVDRRDQRTYDQAAFSRAADRIVSKVEEVVERMETRLDRIEQRQAKSDVDDQKRDTDINQLRLDIGEIRDAVRIGNKGAVVAAAKGFWATKLGKGVVIATSFTALVTAGEKMPKAARAIDNGWQYMVNAGKDDE